MDANLGGTDGRTDATSNTTATNKNQVRVRRALTLSDFIRRPVDENVERPHHARDGDDVEGDRAHDLPPLARRHLELLPLQGGRHAAFEGRQKTNKQNIRQSRQKAFALGGGRKSGW